MAVLSDLMDSGETKRVHVDAGGKILVVDDEAPLLRALKMFLQTQNYEVTILENPIEALSLVRREQFDVALLDIRMPGLSGIDLLERIKNEQPQLEVVMMTAHATVEDALRATKLGAYDFLTKPFDNIDAVGHVVRQALEHKRLIDRNRFLEGRVALSDRFEDLVGRTEAMKDVYELVERVAPTTAAILIGGESGTGKELIARAIHRRSPREGKPMVVVNCGAIQESLFESELFGHVRGAFTGAERDRKGFFEYADGGTIFLDEIGDMPVPLQVKLLRVLNDGEIKRVGSSESKKVDVRVIAATNVDLEEAIREGRFREDLYYRLNVIAIELPPLRERTEDISLLAYHFLAKHAELNKRPVKAIATDAIAAFQAFDWPGNVRQLENAIARAVVISRGDTLMLRDFPGEIAQSAKTVPHVVGATVEELVDLPFSDAKNIAVENFERGYVNEMLRRTEGNISAAARRAGLDRSNFRRVMLRYKDQAERGGGSSVSTLPVVDPERKLAK